MKKHISVYLILLIALAISWHITYLRYKNGAEYNNATLEKLVHFKAATPFQYRILMPGIAVLSGKVAGLFNLTIDTRKFFFATDFISLVLTWFSFALLLKCFLDSPFRRLLLMSLFVYVPLYLCFILIPFSLLYPYDIPQILFFTIGLALIYSGRLKWFILVFIISTLNRETSLFMIPFFLLVNMEKTHLSKGKTIGYAALLLLIWVIIKTILKLEITNPGDFYQTKFQENMIRLYKLNLGTWIIWGCNSLALFALIIFFFLKRLKKYSVNRLFYFLPVFYAAILVFGLMYEYRTFAEIIPVIVLGYMLVGYDLFKKKDRLNN